MSNKAKTSLVPKLRFPEFWGAKGWEETSLGNAASFFKGKGISKADIVTNGRRPCIRYGELYSRYGEVIDDVSSRTDIADIDLFLSQSNDVIIPASGETKLDIAKASCVMHEGIALGSDLNVIRTDGDGVYLSYYLNGPKKFDIAKVAQGDTVVHLYPSQLGKLKIAIPSKLEQKKIADCLSSLDELITAQARKVNALKTHKKGLMQQLFPREGETQPRLRFLKFQHTEAWQKQRVSALLTKSVKPVNVDSDATYREIGIRSHGKGIFHKEPISGKAIGDKRVFWVAEEVLVLNIVFAWEQAVAVTSPAEKGMIASHRFPMYSARPNKANVHFIKYFFLSEKGRELLGIASPGGAGRNKTLGQKDFENLEFLSPNTADEQKEVADTLFALDALISIQSQNLALLKTHKRGLLQQLFPPVEAAEA
jgi:type I restriction enzyme S subunit